MSDGTEIGAFAPDLTSQQEFERAFDPAAEAAREAAQKDEDRKREARRQMLRRLLADPQARSWLWEFLDGTCHAFDVRFASTGHSPDPYGTFLLAGEQRAGWELWKQLDDADPGLAGLMRREQAPGY